MTSRRSRWMVTGCVPLAGVGLMALLPLLAGSEAEPRTITLIARDMTFFTPGDASENPTLRVTRGERVRIVLRNEQSGIDHNVAVPDLDVAMTLVDGEGTGSVVLRAPERPGTHEYLCTPHPRMMRGTLIVE